MGEVRGEGVRRRQKPRGVGRWELRGGGRGAEWPRAARRGAGGRRAREPVVGARDGIERLWIVLVHR